LYNSLNFNVKNVEIFLKYVKNVLVIIKMFYRNQKVFLCVPHLKILKKLLLKQARLGNHSEDVVQNNIFTFLKEIHYLF